MWLMKFPIDYRVGASTSYGGSTTLLVTTDNYSQWKLWEYWQVPTYFNSVNWKIA